MKLVLPAVAWLWIAAAASGQTPERIDLRPHWDVGHTSRYQFTTTRTQNTTMTAGGNTRSAGSTIESHGEVTWRVNRVNADGSYVCAMTLDWMTAALTGPDGQTRTNDSRRASGDMPPVHDLLKAITGVELTVQVAADGSIGKVENVDAMRRKAKNPEMVPEELDFIESATDLATLAGAPASLSPGGSWNIDFKWTHDMGFIHQDATYRLAGVEMIQGVPVAIVNGAARGRLEVDRSEIPDGAPPIDVRLSKSTHESQVLFDLTRHEAVGRNTVDSRTIDITVRLPTPPGPVTRRIEETISSQTLRIDEQ